MLVDEENNYKDKGMRLSEAIYKAVVQAAKARDYASPSAFMRAAVEKELRGADATLDESEQRITASMERYSKQVRRVSTGAAGSVRLRGRVSQSDSQHTARYRRRYEEGFRGARKTPVLPVPEKCWSQYGGRRPGGALGTCEPCPGRLTTTIRSFASGQGSSPFRESGARLQSCPLRSERF